MYADLALWSSVLFHKGLSHSRKSVILGSMRNFKSLLASSLLLASGCGASSVPATRPAADALAAQCQAIEREFKNAVTEGRHRPVVLRVPGQATQPLSEAEFAIQLTQARPGGETLVVARAGSGKSHLSWALQAQVCAKIPTIHVAVAKELAPLYLTETLAKPGLGRFLVEQLEGSPGADATAALKGAFGGAPWLLLIDGADELTGAERKKLETNLIWLRSLGLQQHIVRLERPGYESLKRLPVPDRVVELPALTCAEAESVLHARWPEGKARTDATAWLTRHQLLRKKPGEGCYYVHLSTWRDAEVIAELAEVADAGIEELAEDPTRADIHGQWIINKLKKFGVGSTLGLSWLDRMVALGVAKATEPDLVLTEDRCLGVPGPDGAVSQEYCRGLLRSPVLKPMAMAGSFMFKNQTIADLLMARWLTTHYADCGTLAGATAAIGSLETTAMVASTQAGRLCLGQLVASECSQGVDTEQVATMANESLPLGSRNPVLLDRLAGAAATACERAVFASLLPAP